MQLRSHLSQLQPERSEGNKGRFLLPSRTVTTCAAVRCGSPSWTTTRGLTSTPASGGSRRLPIGRSALQASRTSSTIVMVMTESSELEIGTPAPPFELPEPLTGSTVHLSDFKDAPATLVMFICNHCPFVKHLKAEIQAVAKDYQAKGAAIVAISSNSTVTHPQDGPKEMAEDAKIQGYTFPYLYDADQSVAQAYKAMCTPEFYVFDKHQRLAYHGRFDESRPKNDKPVNGADIRAALDAVLAGQKLSSRAIPSIGCNIKWHPGKEPAYFSG